MYMSKFKKITAIMFAVFFFALSPSMWSFAAEGTLQFSDPTGKVGEEVTVKVKIDAAGAAIGDGTVMVTYDPAMLEFLSGENATGGNGTLNLAATGDGSATVLEYTMVFRALQEGTTTLEAPSYTAYLHSNETLTLSVGNSTVTLEPGDGTTAETPNTEVVNPGTADVEIAGVTYSIYNDFSDVLVPTGFTRTTFNYNGADRNVIQENTTGQYVFYLITGDQAPVMALYNQDTQAFSLTEMANISETSYILLLDEKAGSNLPSQFQETTITLGSVTFPAWQNMNDKAFYLVYARNSNGEAGFYQYDEVDGTFQRYLVSESTDAGNNGSGFTGKIVGFLKDNVIVVTAVLWVLVVVFLILTVILSIKLHRRNEEMDDLYAEVEEFEEKGNSKNKKDTKKGNSGSKEKKKDYDELYIDDEDSFDDFEDELEDLDAFDDFEDEEEDEFEEDDVEEYTPKRSRRTSSKYEDDDDYDVDFIDL